MFGICGSIFRKTCVAIYSHSHTLFLSLSLFHNFHKHKFTHKYTHSLTQTHTNHAHTYTSTHVTIEKRETERQFVKANRLFFVCRQTNTFHPYLSFDSVLTIELQSIYQRPCFRKVSVLLYNTCVLN